MAITYYANDGGSSSYADTSGVTYILGPEDCGFSAPAGYKFACWSTHSDLSAGYQVPAGLDTSRYNIRTDTSGSATYLTITELFAIWVKDGSTLDTGLNALGWSNYNQTTSATLVFTTGSASAPTTWTNTTGQSIKITSIKTWLATGSGHFVNTVSGQYANGSGHKITTRMQLISSNGNTYTCDHDTQIGLLVTTNGGGADGRDYAGGLFLGQDYQLTYLFENSNVVVPASGTLTIKFDKSITPAVSDGYVLCSQRVMQDQSVSRNAVITYSPEVAKTVWRYNGTAWVKDKTIKCWNGTSWEDKEVNYY